VVHLFGELGALLVDFLGAGERAAMDVLLGGGVGVAGVVDRRGGIVGDERGAVGGEVGVGALLGLAPFGFDLFEFLSDRGAVTARTDVSSRRRSAQAGSIFWSAMSRRTAPWSRTALR
jgi:hypothetical protein